LAISVLASGFAWGALIVQLPLVMIESLGVRRLGSVMGTSGIFLTARRRDKSDRHRSHLRRDRQLPDRDWSLCRVPVRSRVGESPGAFRSIMRSSLFAAPAPSRAA